MIVFPGCRFALVAVLVVLGFLVTVLMNACVPELPFWSACVPSYRFGRCLCSRVAVLVGACVSQLLLWFMLVFLVASLVGACDP